MSGYSVTKAAGACQSDSYRALPCVLSHIDQPINQQSSIACKIHGHMRYLFFAGLSGPCSAS